MIFMFTNSFTCLSNKITPFNHVTPATIIVVPQEVSLKVPVAISVLTRFALTVEQPNVLGEVGTVTSSDEGHSDLIVTEAVVSNDTIQDEKSPKLTIQRKLLLFAPVSIVNKDDRVS